MTPQLYLKGLKDLMKIEKEKVIIKREAALKSKDYEDAAFYRDIEKKILDFIDS